MVYVTWCICVPLSSSERREGSRLDVVWVKGYVEQVITVSQQFKAMHRVKTRIPAVPSVQGLADWNCSSPPLEQRCVGTGKTQVCHSTVPCGLAGKGTVLNRKALHHSHGGILTHRMILLVPVKSTVPTPDLKRPTKDSSLCTAPWLFPSNWNTEIFSTKTTA